MADARRNGASNPESYFTALHLQNVRCFAETEIRLDPRLTVMIGENGAGKTTVAEVLASFSYGDAEGLSQFPLRRETNHGEIALFAANQTDSAAFWRHSATSDAHQRLPLVVTGASQGIGRALARGFATDGARVFTPLSESSCDLSNSIGRARRLCKPAAIARRLGLDIARRAWDYGRAKSVLTTVMGRHA